MAIEPHEIGRRIARARERQGWTQMTFALEANVSMSTVQRWEAGKLPPVRELMRIADLLGIDSGELVEPEETREGLEAQIAELRTRFEEFVRREPTPTEDAIALLTQLDGGEPVNPEDLARAVGALRRAASATVALADRLEERSRSAQQ